MFGTNIGSIDRIARGVLGAGLLTCAALRFVRGSRSLAILGALAGATLLYTAATGSCPIHAALGVSTSKQSTTGETVA